MGDGAARHRSALLGKQSRVIIKKEKTEKTYSGFSKSCLPLAMRSLTMLLLVSN